MGPCEVKRETERVRGVTQTDPPPETRRLQADCTRVPVSGGVSPQPYVRRPVRLGAVETAEKRTKRGNGASDKAPVMDELLARPIRPTCVKQAMKFHPDMGRLLGALSAGKLCGGWADRVLPGYKDNGFSRESKHVPIFVFYK